MLLKRVAQKHRFGCFVAAVACAKGTTYDEMRTRLFPKEVASGKKFRHGISAKKNFLKIIESMGLKISVTSDRNIAKMKKPAILFIAWKGENRGHCVVWDPKKKVILDSAYKTPLPLHEYEQQIFKAVYFSR